MFYIKQNGKIVQLPTKPVSINVSESENIKNSIRINDLKEDSQITMNASINDNMIQMLEREYHDYLLVKKLSL